MKTTRKILAVLMMVAVLCSMLIPVNAAENYSITIKNSQPDTTHTYEAYQIFTGDLSKDANGDKVLSNVKWGNGVDSAALLLALASVDEFKDAKTADAIAKVLDENSSNKEVAIQFAEVAGGCLTSTSTASTVAEDKITYTIDGLAAGYYLVKDKDASLGGANETYTSYILNVTDNATLEPKAGTVTVDKAINDNGTTTEAADFSVGDDITFELTGTLPDNYGEFDAFEYEFIDTMSKGLTYNADSVKIYLNSVADENVVATENYLVKDIVTNADGSTTLRVKFADLKKVTTDKDDAIVVVYTAKLNDEAVIGGAGNPNTVYIQYSNNPYNENNGSNDDDDDNDDDDEDTDDDDKGETPEDVVYAFTFELDVTKYNADNEVLAGAEFVLANADGEYAVLDENNKVASWTTSKDLATVLVSNEDGKFIVKGLDSGDYSLEETKAPEGYDLLANPIAIVIYAEVSEGTQGGEVDALTISVDGGEAKDGDTTTGIVDMGVINNPGIVLPETGGIGTTIFYIFGGVLVVGAAVLLITKRRMSSK